MIKASLDQIKKTSFGPFRYSEVGRVELKVGGAWKECPGYWPCIDQNFEFTNIVAVGNKNGVPGDLQVFRQEHPSLKIVFNCQSGPYLVTKHAEILSMFDGIFDLDYAGKKGTKSLFCNHSMMVRSMPHQDFFWPPSLEKVFDYCILTWGPSDFSCKRFDRARRIVKTLSKRRLKGVIYSQRDSKNVVKNSLENAGADLDYVIVHDEKLSEQSFHSLVSQSRFAIFPNTIDAFPKFIIEMLLADVPVVISNDLLLGHKVLKNIGAPCVTELNFESNFFERDILEVFNNNQPTPCRREWLLRYNFELLSKQWAAEFNKLFETQFSQVAFLNHTERILSLES